jgi:hypothetical protein
MFSNCQKTQKDDDFSVCILYDWFGVNINTNVHVALTFDSVIWRTEVAGKIGNFKWDLIISVLIMRGKNFWQCSCSYFSLYLYTWYSIFIISKEILFCLRKQQQFETQKSVSNSFVYFFYTELFLCVAHLSWMNKIWRK